MFAGHGDKSPPFYGGDQRAGGIAMSRTIALRLEDAAASRVVTMWERLYVEWGDQTLLRPDAEPHIILAEVPDHVEASQI
jgi:hypothetical protein